MRQGGCIWRRLAGATLGALALLALAVPVAGAARSYQTEFMDDQLWLGRSNAEVAQSMGVVKSLGADRIKVSAFWRDIAPGTNSTTRPKKFDPTDHADPRYRWEHLDRVVQLARAADLDVTVQPTGPMPLWGSHNPKRGRVYKPRAAEFGKFAGAVAQRYGIFADRFAIWNEPNQGAWLQPQSVCKRTRSGRRTCRSYSPHAYRRLVRAAYPRMKAAAPHTTILIGELAPSGRNDRGKTRPIRPLKFLREMGCRSSKYRRMRSGPCKGFKPATGDAIGHHPYSFLQAPNKRSRSRDDAAIGDTSRLTKVLDRLVHRKALRKRGKGRFSVHYTEFGYQTNPPDPFVGLPVSRQSRWLQESAYLAWRHPRVRTLNQFRLTDGKVRRGEGRRTFVEFQSGLVFGSGKAKPSFKSFPNPFRINKRRVAKGRSVSLWGQIRPARGRRTVEIQRRPGKRWVRVARVRTDRFGVFTRRVKVSSTARYRFRYTDGKARRASDALLVRAR